jgi:hypothetical protein
VPTNWRNCGCVSEVNSKLNSASKLMSRVEFFLRLNQTYRSNILTPRDENVSICGTNIEKILFFSRIYLYMIFSEEYLSCNKLQYGSFWNKIEGLYPVMWLNLDKFLLVTIYGQFTTRGDGLICCQHLL